MVLFDFGNFDWACRDVPSYPVCNLWFRQLLDNPRGLTAPATQLLNLPDAGTPEFTTAIKNLGSGVTNPTCFIPRMGAAGGLSGSLGNIANIIVCGLCVIIGVILALAASRRVAAVARSEMFVMFSMFAIVKGLELADTGGLLRMGSRVITWISAVHVGFIVGLFWVLAWVAFLSLQIVEDGTLFSFIPMFTIGTILTIGSGYIAADTAFTVTNYFQSDPAQQLRSIWLFVLIVIWPAAAAAFYFLVNIGVVVRVLREKKPLLLFTAAAFAFILSQGALFGLGHKMCTGTNQKVDSSFLAGFLELIAIVLIYGAWRSVTEDSWDGLPLLQEQQQ